MAIKLTRAQLEQLFAEGWLGIDEAHKRAQELGWYTPLDEELAQKAELRKAINSIKDPNGLQAVMSVTETDSDGEERRIYKTRAMFELDDYKRGISYAVRKMNYWHHQGAELAKEGNTKFPDAQLDLPLG